MFPLGPFDLIIGKGPKCDVRLKDPLLEAKHCGISHEGPRPVLWAMQSTTGVFVNGFYFPARFSCTWIAFAWAGRFLCISTEAMPRWIPWK